MWLGSTALPKIPSYARISPRAVETAVAKLRVPDDQFAVPRLTEQMRRLERIQPSLAKHLGHLLLGPLDDAARGLGVFLTVVVWLAFESEVGERVPLIGENDWVNTETLLETDESLRCDDPLVAVESDDVIASFQPAIAAFLQDRVEDTVRSNGNEVDIDDVDAVYRLVLIETLVLSYAIRPPFESHPEASAFS